MYDWLCISTSQKVIFHLMDEKPVVLTAFEGDKVYEEYVLMENFVEWARNNLFYTIVTNYSLQAFNANDYFFEECYKLKIGEKKDEFGDLILPKLMSWHIWLMKYH